MGLGPVRGRRCGVASGLLLISSCDDLLDLCGNSILSTVRSPDGARIAVAFARHCGAATAYSTQVSLISKTSRIPKGTGNLFVADANHDISLGDERGILDVRVRWKSSRQLAVLYPDGSRVFVMERKYDGFNIEYIPASAGKGMDSGSDQ